MAQIERQGISINFSFACGMSQYGFQLRGEKKSLAHPAVVQGLLADSVTAKVKAVRFAVP